MTKSQITKRVGWTTAVLALAVLTLSAEAGRGGKGKRGEQPRQRHAQKESGQHRQDNTRARTQRGESRPQERRTNERQASVRRTQERSQPRQSAVVHISSHKRGANWGTNAQRKNIKARQQQVRHQELRVEEKARGHRQGLRVQTNHLKDRVAHQRQELRERDHRLDQRAQTLRHKAQYVSRNTHYSRPTKTVVHHKSTRHSGSSYGKYGHSKYGYSNRHNNHSRLGFRISFGSHDSASFYYDHGHRRHTCCKGGYYTTTWVPALRTTRYDYCGNPYTVVIRAGYYKKIWVDHYCRLNRHHYKRY